MSEGITNQPLPRISEPALIVRRLRDEILSSPITGSNVGVMWCCHLSHSGKAGDTLAFFSTMVHRRLSRGVCPDDPHRKLHRITRHGWTHVRNPGRQYRQIRAGRWLHGPSDALSEVSVCVNGALLELPLGCQGVLPRILLPSNQPVEVAEAHVVDHRRDHDAELHWILHHLPCQLHIIRPG